MKSIPKADAAIKLNRDVEELGDHVYLVTYGNAGTPQRFWQYEAYTKEEYVKLSHDALYVRRII